MILPVVFYLVSAPAYAYVDPSGGSLWIQSLIVIFATVGTVFRVYWHKIKQIWSKKNKSISKTNKTKLDNDD